MESVSVNIYNSEYKLRGEDPDQIRRAATLVDQQMRSVASKVPMQPATTTAVLAALNTAEQLISEQTIAQVRSAEIVEQLNALDLALRQMLETP
ncbi:MAG: cell division protein ZapA [Ignavibacteriae bacterium]|nr:cell division protein ZapA [Ignavibacteriota bacterium]MCB9217140.1 cell division protein ZapA [Ignavibacteria bacterium]